MRRFIYQTIAFDAENVVGRENLTSVLVCQQPKAVKDTYYAVIEYVVALSGARNAPAVINRAILYTVGKRRSIGF